MDDSPNIPEETQRKPRTSTGVRFPPELHDALVAAAEERGLTVNYIVNRLCSEGLAALIPADELRLTKKG